MGSSTILFLHGASLGGWMWQEVISYLPDDYDCLTPDYHENDSANSPFTLDKTVQYLAELVTDVAPVHIVGISLGGLIGLEFLQQKPDSVESAFLSSTSMGPLPGGAIMTALSTPIAWLSARSFTVKATAKQLGMSKLMAEGFGREMSQLTGVLFKQVNESIHHYHPENVSYNINIPVMLVCAGKEPGFVRKNQQRLQQALDLGQVYIVPDAGHGWCFEKPELFAGAVQAWVAGNELPSGLNTL